MKLRRLFCLKRVFFRSFCGKWIPGGSKTTNAAKKRFYLRSAWFSGFYGKNTILKEKGLETWAARFLPCDSIRANRFARICETLVCESLAH